MAKIMLGSLAGAISGALGNDVFSHNRHGAYVRRRVIPTKVTNAYTIEARNILAAAAQGWGLLSAEQQATWNTWAKSHPITDRLGQKQELFGAGAYTQINARILRSGDTYIEAPSAASAPSPLTALSGVASEATQAVTLTFAATPLAATERLWVQAALLVKPGVNYYKNLLKLVAVSPLAEASTLVITTEIAARFGNFLAGHRFVVMAAVYESTSGLLSSPMLAEFTAGA